MLAERPQADRLDGLWVFDQQRRRPYRAVCWKRALHNRRIRSGTARLGRRRFRPPTCTSTLMADQCVIRRIRPAQGRTRPAPEPGPLVARTKTLPEAATRARARAAAGETTTWGRNEGCLILRRCDSEQGARALLNDYTRRYAEIQ